MGTKPRDEPRPSGTSAQRALRCLRKNRPDLHTRVLAGELSPHAAMIEVGYRRPTFAVYEDNPVDAARQVFTAIEVKTLTR